MPAKLPSRLVQSRHGIYYLRIIQNGREQRRSLRTRDPAVARDAAYQFGAKIRSMKNAFDFDLDPEMRAQIDQITIRIRAQQLADEARIEAAARKLAGLDDQPAPAAHPQPVPSTTQPAAPASGTTVAEACDGYLALRTPEITSSTLRSWRTALDRLKRDLGHLAVDAVTTEQLNSIGAALDAQKRARATIENYYDTWDLLFAWLKDTGKIPQNPVRKPKWSRTIAKRLDAERGRPRHPYAAVDLEKLFNRDRLAALARPEELWLPILALYTGARLESLCRLRTSDFTEYAPGCWQVHFDPQYDKCGRNRDIPLHPALIDAGLIEYIADVKRLAIEGDYLFPLLGEVAGRRGHYASKRYGDRRKALGIERGKDFHSFRTTIISTLEYTRAHHGAKRAFVGHEEGDNDDVHARDYEKATYTVQDLATEILPRLDFAAWPGYAPDLKGIYNHDMLKRFIAADGERKPRGTAMKMRKK